jgi:light-regulated signal transduction histidine kinase (bacteriophytochrome)
MTKYPIHFTEEQALQRFQALHSGGKWKQHGIFFYHSMASPIWSAIGNLPGVYGLNPHLIPETELLETELVDYCKNLLAINSVLDQANLHETALRTFVSKFYHQLEQLVLDLEATQPRLALLSDCKFKDPVLAEIGSDQSLSDKYHKFTSALQMGFYSLNRFFAPEFQRTEWLLGEDLAGFAIENAPIFHEQGISYDFGEVYIQTTRDYMLPVFAQIIWNAVQHAFTPENDINGRLEKGFLKQITVFGAPDNQEYVISVKDNGFGISPSIADKLLKEPCSTKQGSGGDGMWTAKQYVEEDGGRLWFETEPGQGTTWHVALTYKERMGFLYIQ